MTKIDFISKHWNKGSIEDFENDLSDLLKQRPIAPHRCPICGGNGLVPGSFYTSVNGGGGTSFNISEQCRQCEGKGILWG